MSDDKIGAIAAGIVLLVCLLLAIAFRFGCASVCEERGGHVIWTSGGEVVCIEPERAP